MKLISCQSRGDRLVKIYQDNLTFVVDGLIIPRGLNEHQQWHASFATSKPKAFEAAEEWLKGANQ